MIATIHRIDASESAEYRRLTPRQRTVLRLTAEGKSMKEIGRIIGLRNNRQF